MRTLPLPAILIAALFVMASPASAQEPRAAVQGFGGLGMGSLTTTNTNFGGVVTAHLTPNVQLVGEAGRIGNLLPSTTQTLRALSPVGFGVSAWYGEDGVRVTGGSSIARPYAEATIGIARLQPQVTSIGSGLPAVIANAGLSLLSRTDPIASVGGGVTLQGGPLFVDVGYRHRRVFSDSWVQTLALGGALGSNEVRLGFGVRF